VAFPFAANRWFASVQPSHFSWPGDCAQDKRAEARHSLGPFVVRGFAFVIVHSERSEETARGSDRSRARARGRAGVEGGAGAAARGCPGAGARGFVSLILASGPHRGQVDDRLAVSASTLKNSPPCSDRSEFEGLPPVWGRRGRAPHPSHGPACHNRGVSVLESGDDKEAMAAFHEAIRLNPPWPKHMLAWGAPLEG
jgi:hypothetical protein